MIRSPRKNLTLFFKILKKSGLVHKCTANENVFREVSGIHTISSYSINCRASGRKGRGNSGATD